jgi:peptide/nickel transport system permease protein
VAVVEIGPVMRSSARIAVRALAAWIITWLVGWSLIELANDPPARIAARAAARLPPDEVGTTRTRAVIEAAVARDLGLDGGVAGRFARVLGRAVALSPGPSWRDHRPAGQVARRHAGATIGRALLAMMLAMVIGAGGPLLIARRRLVPGVLVIVAGGAVAMPAVWLCQLALATTPAAATSSTLAILVLMIAPAAAIALHVSAGIAQLDRAPLAIAVAARGASRRRWHCVHVARLLAPGLAPLVGSSVGFALGASPVVERALALPGAGQAVILAATVGDAPVLLTLAAATAALVALVAGVAAAVGGMLDPRREVRS